MTTQPVKSFRVIIAGGRDFNQTDKAFRHIDKLLRNIDSDLIEIVEGGAKGADVIGREYAISRGIPYKTFEADWDGLGKRAGYVRNAEMATYSTHLIAFWDGKSRGTSHMIDLAKREGLRISVAHY